MADNIRYNQEDATEEEVIEAAKTVGAHDFIMNLENGYDTVLAERGVNLSVGQRQLLSFARAVVGDPRVIILDEATANIDTQTELMIQEALQRVLVGRTSIVIAHRLSTVRNADKIIVLNRGELVEMGSHEELLALNGVYERLYAVNYGLLAESDTAAELDALERGERRGASAGEPDSLPGAGLLPAPADD